MYQSKSSQSDDQGDFDAKPIKRVKRHYEKWRLGNRLLSCRIVQDMTQAQLAAKVGVTRVTIARIETCRQQPTVGLALLIAEALDEPVDTLFYVRRPQYNIYQ